MNNDHTITATLTVVFGMEDKPSEEEAQEHFLEWLGSSSDGFILEGLDIKMKQDDEEDNQFFDIVFDGPPGPVPGRFVEVENSEGAGMSVGAWVKRPDDYWVLRIRPGDVLLG